MADLLWTSREYRLPEPARTRLCAEIEKLLKDWRRAANHTPFGRKRLVATVLREVSILTWANRQKIQDAETRRAEIELVQRTIKEALDAEERLGRDSRSDIRIAQNFNNLRDIWLEDNAVIRITTKAENLKPDEQIERLVTASQPPSILSKFREISSELLAQCDAAIAELAPPKGPTPNNALDEFARGTAVAFDKYFQAGGYGLVTRDRLTSIFEILKEVPGIGGFIEPVSAATLARKEMSRRKKIAWPNISNLPSQS